MITTKSIPGIYFSYHLRYNGFWEESVTEKSTVWELMYFGKAGANKK